jgi:hypothetical protein
MFMRSNGIATDVNLLTIRRTKARLPLPQLAWMAFRYIFNKNGEMNSWLSIPDNKMSKEEIADLMSSIVNWNDWIRVQKEKLAKKFGNEYVFNDIRPVGTKGTVLDEIEFRLSRLGWIMHEGENGTIHKKYLDFMEHKIDYKKHYGLQQAFKPSDFIKAQEALKQAMRDNPEDYAKPK